MRHALFAATVVVLAAFGSAAGATGENATHGVTTIRAPLPRNAGSRYDFVAADIACASPVNCVATGNLYKPSSASYGVFLIEKAGKWTVGEPSLPRKTKRRDKSRIALGRVSCPAVGRCVAVADAHAGAREEALIFTQRRTGWRGTVLATPPGAQGAGLRLVSCPSPGNCTAAGRFTNASGDGEGLLVTERAGRWARPVAAALPPDAARHPESGFNDAAEIDSLSCPSAGNCAAVGSYTDTRGSPEGLLLTETHGRWSRGVEAQLPANASPPDGSSLYPLLGLGSVSCSSASDCTAVGGYGDERSYQQFGMTLSEQAGRWAPAQETPLPANAGPNPQEGNLPGSPMGTVACPTAGMCSAVGYYREQNGDNGGLLLSERAGEWTASALSFPSGEAEALGGGLESLACPSAGNCLAVGLYNTGINRYRPMLVTEQNGAWMQGRSAPLPPGVSLKKSGDIASVSCPSATTCVAVGSYGGIGGTPTWGPNYRGFIATIRGG